MSKTSRIIGFMSAATLLLGASNAFADCSEVSSSRWNDLSNQMANAYEQGDYNAALDYGKSLTFICDRAPLANYMLSETYRALGRDEEALSAIRRATDYLHNYDVPQAVIEKIWLRRGELELPYKKQAESLQAQLDDKTTQMEALEAAYKEQLVNQAAENDASTSSTVNYLRSEYIDDMYTLQWTGTGLAVGGAAIAIAGASIVGVYYSKAGDDYKKLLSGSSNHFNEYNSYEKFGYAFLAAGLGLGVAGMITAIIAHVKINNLESAAEPAEETANVSFDLSPSYMGLTVQF